VLCCPSCGALERYPRYHSYEYRATLHHQLGNCCPCPKDRHLSQQSYLIRFFRPRASAFFTSGDRWTLTGGRMRRAVIPELTTTSVGRQCAPDPRLSPFLIPFHSTHTPVRPHPCSRLYISMRNHISCVIKKLLRKCHSKRLAHFSVLVVSHHS
jgi:hypothetical protein